MLVLFAGQATAEDKRATTVGMPARIDQLVLPGPELEAKPLDDARTPVVLRIAAVYPHGTAFRYDLVYYGLDPGTYDLKDYLQRKDGSPTKDLPSIRVEVQAILPPGQVVPNPLEAKGTPFLGGYRLALWIGGVLWVLGLLAILLVGRRKKADAGTLRAAPATFADRLRPLVERAMNGQLSTTQRAELERTLLAFWRRQLRLQHTKPAEAMTLLRTHPEAGPLLVQLEAWLHRPAPVEQVDVSALLRPYQNAPAEGADT